MRQLVLKEQIVRPFTELCFVNISATCSCFAQVKEIIDPLGATIDVREVKLGDETMSVLEIWGAEYQENDALLIKPEARKLLETVCARERCSLQVCHLCHPSDCTILQEGLPRTFSLFPSKKADLRFAEFRCIGRYI